MEDPKFTPGPWHYRPDEFDDWGVVKADRFTICQARAWDALDEDVLNQHRRAGTDPWEANARLIAAAPSLYEALDQILDDMGSDQFCCCPAAKEQAIAAMAKARGEKIST